MDDVAISLRSSETYFLVAAIANVIAFLAGSVSVLIGGAATCGVGCVLIVLPLINMVVAIFDFLAMRKLKEPPSPSTHSFLKTAAILDLFAGLAVIPLVMGILNLQVLGRPEVYNHFHQGPRVP